MQTYCAYVTACTFRIHSWDLMEHFHGSQMSPSKQNNILTEAACACAISTEDGEKKMLRFHKCFRSPHRSHATSPLKTKLDADQRSTPLGQKDGRQALWDVTSCEKWSPPAPSHHPDRGASF